MSAGKKRSNDGSLNAGPSFRKDQTKTQSYSSRQSNKVLIDVIKRLSDVQKKDISDVGFGPLLDLNCSYTPKIFACWLVSRFDTATRSLRLPDGSSCELNALTINEILGIPLGANSIPLRFSQVASAAIKQEFSCNGNSPSIEELNQFITADLTGPPLIRAFLLLALCIFLCPTTHRFPSPCFFPALLDVEKIISFDWCTLVLNWLVGYIARYQQKVSEGKSPALGGCVFALVVFYLEFLSVSPVQISNPTPVLRFWSTQNISTLIRLDTVEGCTNKFGRLPVKHTNAIPFTSSKQSVSRKNVLPADVEAFIDSGIPSDYLRETTRRNLVDVSNMLKSNIQEIIVSSMSPAISSYTSDVLRLILHDKFPSFNHSSASKPESSGCGMDSLESDENEVECGNFSESDDDYLVPFLPAIQPLHRTQFKSKRNAPQQLISNPKRYRSPCFDSAPASVDAMNEVTPEEQRSAPPSDAVMNEVTTEVQRSTPPSDAVKSKVTPEVESNAIHEFFENFMLLPDVMIEHDAVVTPSFDDIINELETFPEEFPGYDISAPYSDFFEYAISLEDGPVYPSSTEDSDSGSLNIDLKDLCAQDDMFFAGNYNSCVNDRIDPSWVELVDALLSEKLDQCDLIGNKSCGHGDPSVVEQSKPSASRGLKAMSLNERLMQSMGKHGLPTPPQSSDKNSIDPSDSFDLISGACESPETAAASNLSTKSSVPASRSAKAQSSSSGCHVDDSNETYDEAMLKFAYKSELEYQKRCVEGVSTDFRKCSDMIDEEGKLMDAHKSSEQCINHSAFSDVPPVPVVFANDLEINLYDKITSVINSNEPKPRIFQIGNNWVDKRTLALSMRAGCWLNVHVMDAFSAMFNHAQRELVENNEFGDKALMKLHLTSSTIDVLMDDHLIHSDVRDTLSKFKLGIRIDKVDHVYMPCQIDRQWILLVANLKERRFDILNPELGVAKSCSTIHTVIHNFKCLFLLSYERWVSYNIRDFKVHYVHVPKQTFRYDSGIFVLTFSQYYDGSSVAAFSNVDLLPLRQKLLFQLLNYEHNIHHKTVKRILFCL